jgi:hypothetical protein
MGEGAFDGRDAIEPAKSTRTISQKARERIRRNNTRWRKSHLKEFAKYCSAYAQRHPNRRMWSVAKQRAKKRGIIFTITPEDVVIPKYCPALGIELVLGVGISGRQGGNPNSPSLDRIIPSLGYVPGNVRVISHLANSMKGAATQDQLEKFAKWVLNGDA